MVSLMLFWISMFLLGIGLELQTIRRELQKRNRSDKE